MLNVVNAKCAMRAHNVVFEEICSLLNHEPLCIQDEGFQMDF